MDEAPPRPTRREALVGWIAIAAGVAVVVAFAIPVHQKSRIIARQNNAGVRLDALRSADETWKQNDCDRNGVADYWTRDVAGFH